MSATATPTPAAAGALPVSGFGLLARQLGALVLHTIRESLHRWTMLAFLAAVSLFLLLLATAVNLDIVEGTLASARLFGQDLEVQQFNVRIDDVVGAFQVVIIGALYVVGIALALFATSNFVPRLCEEGWVDLMLAQPVSRSTLLLGRALGAIGVVAINLSYLVIGSWLLLRWKTGFGNAGFLLAGALILFAFVSSYAAMVLVGVMTRSAPVASMVGLFVWVMGHILYALHRFPNWRLSLQSGWPRRTATAISEAMYWFLPKNQALGQAAVDAARGQSALLSPSASWLSATAPVWGSLPFILVTLGAACWWFSRRDY